ncbi:MAG: M28 family peptidase [Acidobacteriota bacterium]|nr:M28 family peptidase [Acidobacteriota bacterium]
MRGSFRFRLVGVLPLLLLLSALRGSAAVPPAAASAGPAPADLLPPVVDQVATALDGRFDQARAMALVRFMDQYWRLAGNPGFNATIDHIKGELTAAGFADGAEDPRTPHVWVESYPAPSPGWNDTVGTVAVQGAHGQAGTVVLSRAGQRNALCINSFSTPSGGITARLVDVGDGSRSSDYAGRDLRGAIVLGDAEASTLWDEAVVGHGAAGVISTALGVYVRPEDANSSERTPRDQWNVLQWNRIPYDPVRKGFGFKATPKAAATLRRLLAAGPVTLHVTVQSTFTSGPDRTLIAEIPGTTRPAERIVMAAHVQEPGANDDASGCATLLGLATALRQAIAAGSVPRPARTLTFMWVDEVRGSRQWLQDHPDEAAGVQYMLSLDMTGEDTAKTGGTFLIEKGPDPSATWPRPSDPHTLWYHAGDAAPRLKGSLLNDLHLAVCQRYGRRTGWVVRTNPYEGGSDHTVYIEAGIPALLNWHFPDRYYHTNLDRPDKTSPLEMQRVAGATATTALLLASATPAQALAVAKVIAAAAGDRLALETRQGADIIGAAADPAEARVEEQEVMDAWRVWYIEALGSVRRLPVTPADPALTSFIDAAIAKLER